MISNQIIKDLANNSLDSKGKVEDKIARYVLENLNKKELKLFLRRFKKISNEKKVTVKYEGNLTNEIKKSLESMFENRIINYEQDKNLGGGIMIIDNDMIVNYTIDGLIASRIKLI